MSAETTKYRNPYFSEEAHELAAVTAAKREFESATRYYEAHANDATEWVDGVEVPARKAPVLKAELSEVVALFNSFPHYKQDFFIEQASKELSGALS